MWPSFRPVGFPFAGRCHHFQNMVNDLIKLFLLFRSTYCTHLRKMIECKKFQLLELVANYSRLEFFCDRIGGIGMRQKVEKTISCFFYLPLYHYGPSMMFVRKLVKLLLLL